MKETIVLLLGFFVSLPTRWDGRFTFLGIALIEEGEKGNGPGLSRLVWVKIGKIGLTFSLGMGCKELEMDWAKI